MTDNRNRLEILNGTLAEFNERVNKLQEEMQAVARPVIKEAATEIFDVCPEIHSFHWHQYTPYFNDGEPCTFSVHDVFMVLERDVDEYGDLTCDSYEGSFLYSARDLENYETLLKEVLEYESDPEKWQRKYREEKGFSPDADASTLPFNLKNPRPSWKSSSDLRKEIALAKADVELYGAEQTNQIEKATRDMGNIIQAFPETVMQFTFGDHAKVTITRDDIIVDEYEHG